MRCPSCHHENDVAALFCAQCGSRLVVQEELVETCAACGAILLPGSKFCGQCGSHRAALQSCRSCGHVILPGNRFCGECGAPVADGQAQTAAETESSSALVLPRPDINSTGIHANPERIRGLAGFRTPMVGRQEMLDELIQTWKTVQEQHKCQIALLTGDAGVGKTRLVAEFRRLLDPAVSVYQGNCLAHTRSTPFWLLGRVLRDSVNLADGEPAAVVHERVTQYLHEQGLPAVELAPYILNVLGVEQPSADLSTRLAMMDAAMLQQQTHSVLHQMVRAAARSREFVLILEDIHWIDAASRNFLIELLRSAHDLPIFLLLVSRSHERTTVIQPILSALEKQPAWTVDMQMEALSAEQEYSLIDQLLSQAGLCIPTLQRHIARRAQGNPLHIEEIVRMLQEQFADQSSPAEGDGTKAAPLSLDAAAVEELMSSVPSSLTGLILARCERMHEPLRRAVHIAAVIGRTFSPALLRQLLDVSAEEVSALLAALVERQFLIEEPNEQGSGFSFRHALVQAAVYGALLNQTRRQIHSAVAAALQSGAYLAPDEQVEALAYHYSHAQDPQQAIPYLAAAAHNANRRGAYEISLPFHRRALALFDAEPTLFSPIYSQVHVGLGKGLKLSGEFAEARLLLLHGYDYLRQYPEQQAVELPLILETVRELADVCQRAGDFTAAHEFLQEALSLATAIKGSPLWYTLVERAVWVQLRMGELDGCTQMAREAIRHLEEHPDPQPFTLASLYNTMGRVAWQEGNLSEAIAYVEASLSLYESQGFVWGVSVACSHLGLLHWTLGYWAAGAEWYERAVKMQAENGFSFELATSLRNLGSLRMAQGDMEIARHNFEQSLALCLQQNHSYGALATHLALGSWAVAMGDSEEISRQLQAARTLEESADTDSLIGLHLLAAQDLSNQEKYAEAIQSGQQALQLATDVRGQADLVEVYHVLGVVYGKAGEFEQAEHHLVKARQLAAERNTPDRAANAQLELALVYERMAHRDAGAVETLQRDALDLVRAAIVEFERLGARAKLRRARALEENLFFHSTVDEPWVHDDSPVEPANGIRISVSAGARQQSANTPPDGERAHVTILWLNLYLTGLSDEEDAFSQMAEILGTISQIIKRCGGYLIRQPEGVVAAFGAPVACEDAPTRSVHCAIQIAAHLDGVARSGAGALSYHIGLEHGDAVVGFLDPHNRSLFVVTGDPMIRAQQLAQAVPSGSIWLSRSLAKLAEKGYRFQPVERDADGDGVLAQAVEFVAALPDDGAQDQRQPRTRLIGRSPVLANLMQRAEALARGQSGFVWLEGEAGIGKSRLLEEFCDLVDASQFFVWRGNCSSQDTQQPFSLFSSLLHDIFGLGAANTSDERRAKLQQQLNRWTANHQDVQLYLELLCGISPALHDAQRLANLEPEALRQQIFVAVRALLVGMVQQRPLVLVLDDLHWLDPMSASLLVFLSQMVASMPVLFVFSQRPASGQGVLSELSSIRDLHEDKNWRINLEGLSQEDSLILLGELLPVGQLSMHAYRFILERSDGNPYYMEEFLRLLIEQEYLHLEGNVWSPQTNTSLQDLPLPVTLEALIRSRVDSLPMPQRQLLQLAAVIGRPFSLQLLDRLAQPIAVEQHLQELSQRNLLVARTGKQEWQFNHHLAQIVVHNSMLRVRLKALHLQVADALEAEWGDASDEHAEELAHHLCMAQVFDRALRYLVIAGERAETRYANDEALSYYRRAREILQESAGVVADELRWRVIVGLGDTYRFVGKYDLSMAALEEGLEMMQRGQQDAWRKAGIFRRLGQTCVFRGNPEAAYDHFRQALVALEEPADRRGQIEAACTLYFLTYTHFRRGQWEKARETCELCRLYAEKADDLSDLAAAENLLGGIAYQQGEREQAMQHTAMAMQLRERAGYTWGVASTMGNLAILAGESGDWDRAKNYFLRSLRLRQELGDMEGIAIVNNNLGWLGRIKGALDEAEHHFREGLKVAEPFKMIYHAANAMLGIGHICQLKGNIEEAQQMISGSAGRAEQVDAQDLLSEIYRVQADILLEQNGVKEAEESARWAVLLASETGSSALEADAWRVVSECLYRQGHLRRAEEAIHLACAALGADDTSVCGRVAIQAGRLLCALGRFQEARLEFRKAEELLGPIGAEYDLGVLSQARLALSPAPELA